MTTKLATSHFFTYRDKIEQEIARSIVSLGEKTKLRDACEYALKGGGKRLRPLVVFLIAEALDQGLDVSESALAVEFFHTASLIADDLPCMDNEEERRGRPTVHKIYGEAIALLASYGLITAAFEKIHNNGQNIRSGPLPFAHTADRACMIALQAAAHSAGILGATGGQFFDLFPPACTLEAVRQVIYKKTITLFEVAFVFGWVFGGGDFEKLERVKQAAYHLGMAFQIADDLGDLVQDETKERAINMARFLGKEKALALFEEEMGIFQKYLEELNLNTPSFEKMRTILFSMSHVC